MPWRYTPLTVHRGPACQTAFDSVFHPILGDDGPKAADAATLKSVKAWKPSASCGPPASGPCRRPG